MTGTGYTGEIRYQVSVPDAYHAVQVNEAQRLVRHPGYLGDGAKYDESSAGSP
jgi:hypothetical protein